MDTKELVKLASQGNISEFQSGVSDEVLSRLRTKIEDYRIELASTFSATQEDNE